MSTSTGMNAAGYNLLLTVYHMIYIFAYYDRSVLVMNIISFASVMFVLLIFWIKLLVNLPKFPTMECITLYKNLLMFILWLLFFF
jgi:hypothetical protein